MRQLAHSIVRSGWAGLCISLCFWTSLGLSALLALLLVISPRLVENVQLQQRLVKNASALIELHEETQHLAAMEHALRTDPDFVSRLAAEELHPVLQGVIQVEVPADLRFDARVYEPVQTQLKAPSLWCLPLFESMAQPGNIRNRCTLLAAALLLVAFCCFHEGLTDGSLSAQRGQLLGLALSRYRGRSASADDAPQR